jgi:hypothetical protein
MTPATPYEPAGSWDSIHVFETVERGRQAHYKLTSTVMLQLVTRKASSHEKGASAGALGSEGKGPDGLRTDGEVTLSGSMTRQVSRVEFDWVGMDDNRTADGEIEDNFVSLDLDATALRIPCNRVAPIPTEHKLTVATFPDRAGLADTRRLFAYYQHREDDRGNGDQDAEFASRGPCILLLTSVRWSDCTATSLLDMPYLLLLPSRNACAFRCTLARRVTLCTT